MNEEGLGCREAANPDTWLTVGLLYVSSVTPLPLHMLLECHLLHQCPVLLVIC